VNYLAHVFLARQSGEAMVGALMGDFVKGEIDGRYPPDMAFEIRLHRRIDSFTDAHPVVLDAKARFPQGRRRFAGIVLDVFYDHVLSRRWDAHADEPRREVIDRAYVALEVHHPLLPDRLQRVAPWMIAQDWLGSYAELPGVERAVERLSTRLSRDGHLLRDGLQDVRANYDALSEGFDRFFPDLVEFVRESRSGAGG
jgi:acyl carrier protein phosphodiesterase